MRPSTGGARHARHIYENKLLEHVALNLDIFLQRLDCDSMFSDLDEKYKDVSSYRR